MFVFVFVFLKLWESWDCLDGVNEFEEKNLAFGLEFMKDRLLEYSRRILISVTFS